MNIDKAAMESAWTNRHDRLEYRKLLKMIDEMINYFAMRLKISPRIRDDLTQEVRIAAANAIEKYQPARKSSVFSFLYRSIYIGFLYFLRRDYQKAQRSVQTCSYDIMFNSIGDDVDVDNENSNEPSYSYHDDDLVQLGNHVYEKRLLMLAVVEAKKLHRKKDVKASSIEDPLVKLCYEKMIERSKRRKENATV